MKKIFFGCTLLLLGLILSLYSIHIHISSNIIRNGFYSYAQLILFIISFISVSFGLVICIKEIKK